MERIVHAYTCTVNRLTHAPFEGEKAVAKGQVARVEENIAADRIELSAEQIERLKNLAPAAGERHDEGKAAVIDR